MIEIHPAAVTTDLLLSPGGLPLIICAALPRLQKKLEAAGYQTVHINIELSKRLLSFAPDERPARVEGELRKILNGPDPMFLTDFEMLFDPRYEIDILKIFCERARFAAIAVRWPGRSTSDKLTYAGPEAPDHHEYDCSKYQIRLVKQEERR